MVDDVAIFDSARPFPADPGRASAIDPLLPARLEGPMWSAESDQPGAYFGCSVATAGDVNGDGFSDVIVGAQTWYDTEFDTGGAFLYLGSAEGLSAAYSWYGTSSQGGAQFGACVAPAGDVNGDGYGDVIIGSPLYDHGQTDEGRAFVFLGSPTGLQMTPSWTAESDQDNAQFGLSVATAGDVNGDGYDDVIVGAHYFDGGSTNEGRAYVYLGSATGLSSTAAWTVESNQAGAELGISVSGAGDVNADGYADVIVGASLHDYSAADRGRAWVYLGSASGLSTTAAWTRDGALAGDHFGACVAGAGDVNGDGYADVLVGAPDADDTTSGLVNEGRAYVFFGSATGPMGTALWTAKGGQDSARLGCSAATAGDVNGDLFADVVVGARGYDGSATDGGRALLYLGSAVELFSTPAWTGELDQTDARFGWSVATGGDVDGDGCSDLLVGTGYWDGGQGNEGGAWCYKGAAAGLAGVPSWLEIGGHSGDQVGAAVAGAGDTNADGFSDVVVGAPLYDGTGEPNFGRAWEYLGYPTGPHDTATWTGYGEQESAQYGARLARAGDVNGDGYDDVLVSAYQYSLTPQSYEGKVWLHLGSENGILDAPAWSRIGDRELARFGYAIASAGDVDGDGYGDVLIGCDFYTTDDQTFRGKAYLYLGSESGLSSEPAWEREGSGTMATFGAALASAGDVNGDGYGDVLIGAPAYIQSGRVGRAYLFLGSPGGLAVEPSWTGSLGQANDFYGISLGSAGDFNGDGFGDVIVGASGYEEAGYPANGGAAALYLGSAAGLSAAPYWLTWIDQQDAALGTVVGSAGDVNGDGYGDVFYTAPSLDQVYVDQGAVWVKLGSAEGYGGLPEWTRTIEVPASLFGSSAGGAGDTNGDGFDDLIVGARGYSPNPLTSAGIALVFLGNEKNVSYHGRPLIGRQTQEDGGPLAWLGRSEDTTDFGLAATGSGAGGRARIRLEWQSAELGASLSGASLEHGGWYLSWAPLPDVGSVVPLTAVVSDGEEGTARIWRFRAASHSPFFPHGPWMSMAGTVPSQEQLRLGGVPSGWAEDLADPVESRTLRIESVRPNPFAGRTSVAYSSTEAGRARITVHDVSGREVAILVDEWKDAGRYVAHWSGGSSDGAILPNGVYYARLSWNDRVRTTKVVLRH